MRIYIARSTFEVFEDKDGLDAHIRISLELHRHLQEAGHEVVHTKENEWIPYAQIKKLIESCDCLIGFTDEITLSGTWRAIEITYAHSGMGAFKNTGFHIPVFLYRGLDNKNFPFIESMIKRQDVHVLPSSIKDAVKFIESLMSKPNNVLPY